MTITWIGPQSRRFQGFEVSETGNNFTMATNLAQRNDSMEKTTDSRLENADPVEKPVIDSAYRNEVGYTEYIEGQGLDYSDSEARRVRWKIDLIILPIFLITQMLQFIDKTALNYANLFGYQEALGLEGDQFNYLAAMVYAG